MVGPLAPADAPAAEADDDDAGGYWLVAAAAVATAFATLAWVLLDRRRADPIAPAGDAVPLPEAPVAIGAGPRARLTLAFRPLRAGVNILSATSENEVTVANIGDAAAEDVRLQLRLFAARAGQEAELAAFYAAPIGRPAAPAFALAPGEARTLKAVAALPREAIHPLNAAGRPMFVPIVAVNLVYATAGGEGQLAQSYAVGVERVDSAKLAPFWLDVPARSFDQVAARAQGAGVDR